jgi:hypothetical protein
MRYGILEPSDRGAAVLLETEGGRALPLRQAVKIIAGNLAVVAAARRKPRMIDPRDTNGNTLLKKLVQQVFGDHRTCTLHFRLDTPTKNSFAKRK